jgi:uncharacterized membrane-anchored protein YhcB (DUF1043 family)
MINFIFGLFIGAFIGVLIASLCVTSSRSNEQLEKINFNKESVNTEDNEEQDDVI